MSKIINFKNAAKRNIDDSTLFRLGILLATVIAIIVTVVLILAANGTNVAKAKDNKDTSTAYVSVMITSGDSLWSIANEYCSDYSRETSDTVEMLKHLNGMDSDKIYAGSYILIPQQVEI